MVLVCLFVCFEWSPEKLIKELPSLVPSEDAASKGTTESAKVRASAPSSEKRPDSPESSLESSNTSVPEHQQQQQQQQNHGDHTGETEVGGTAAAAAPPAFLSGPEAVAAADPSRAEQCREELGKSPGEIAFFKLLHTEFRKASYFFEKAQTEFEIREERVREGMNIMKQPNSILVNEKWSMLAKSIYRLYKDLLLLETYAIMAYCSFSKILKKHDKVTGHNTRSAFMTNVVNKANFTNYPKVLAMISRCEQLYDEVSQRLLQEGKQGLYEDERLFINMINRLNDQVLGTADGEGACTADRKEGRRVPEVAVAGIAPQKPVSEAVSTLRSLVEANDKQANAAQVSEGQTGVDTHLDDRKPPAAESPPATKRFKKG